ncbi:MAG: hypothetical protein HRU27_16305 [Rhizobiaceae bacterium]|nr:hypothetical protein [Hyphomicrobiales bacterium]NRB32152.1 hypothetical protein [Rhizobiaceae bacterium]
MSLAVSQEGRSAGWLRSTSFDTTFILGIAALAIASGLVVIQNPSMFPLILFLDLWVLGYHHVISTYTRLAFDAESRRANQFFLYGLPPIVLVATVSLALGVGLWTIGTIYLYWQWFHYTRQSWGVSQAYRRKSGGLVRENETLTKWAFYSLPAWGIAYRSYQDPGVFLGLELRVIPVPEFVVYAAAAVSIATLGAWSFMRLKAFLNGEGPIAHTLYMLSHFVIFGAGYLLIEDITYGWLVINIWHNAQYVLFVWLFNTNKFKDGETTKARLLSKLSQPQNRVWYFGFCIALSTVIYASISVSISAAFAEIAVPLALVIYSAINFHHYIVDSYIWKMRKPTIQKTMDIEEVPH